ncbi:MAG: hypothetical protein DRP56_06730 [Planctomycetota bacterium]|nr:MAG: hypothetical protein DRP56_06730 [Planctomycetota bacterium]
MSFFTINDKRDYSRIAIVFQGNIKEMLMRATIFFEIIGCGKPESVIIGRSRYFFSISLNFFR